MSKKDYEAIAAAIAAVEGLIEGTDPGGFGASTLRLVVNQIGGVLAEDSPRFNRALFEVACMPAEHARRAAAIRATLEAQPLGQCECEGPVRETDDGECTRCGRPVGRVHAFQNGGEWHAAALLEVNAEIDAGQCDSCGSFDPVTGEPGAGFILRHMPRTNGRRGWVAVCGCCGALRPVYERPVPEVVF